MKFLLLALVTTPMMAMAQIHGSEALAGDARLSAIDRFAACLRTSASDLDDGVSPASDIARAAALDCAPQWQRVLMLGNESLLKMNDYPSKSVSDSALREVLEMRRAKGRNKK